MTRHVNYRDDLLADLRNDAEFAAEYLSAAKADSKEAFLAALRDVAEARAGMKALARRSRLNRESLYRALSRNGNPSISTLDSVLNALGIQQTFVVKHAARRKNRRASRPPL